MIPLELQPLLVKHLMSCRPYKEERGEDWGQARHGGDDCVLKVLAQQGPGQKSLFIDTICDQSFPGVDDP